MAEPTPINIPNDTEWVNTVQGIGNGQGADEINLNMAATALVKRTNWLKANTLLLSGNQTVDGIKTFEDSPIVPEPTQPEHAASKSYVDSRAGATFAGFYYPAEPLIHSLPAGWTAEIVGGDVEITHNFASMAYAVVIQELDSARTYSLAGFGPNVFTVGVRDGAGTPDAFTFQIVRF